MAKVQALDGTPEHKRPLVYDTMLAAISLAWRSVHLTTGYFVPTPELAHVLKRAARRGVDVEIMVPGSSDSALAMAAGRASYEDLLEAGVRIFERQGEVLHAKTAVIDGTWCTVGSSNLDWRSAVLNNEVNAVVLDCHLGDELEALFRTDLAASREINRRDWASRPLGERFDEWSARLFQRLL